MKKRLFYPFFAVILAAALTGCNSQPPTYSRSFFAMDTLMSITASGDNSEQAVNKAAEKISQLETLLSVTLPDSDVGRINGGSSPVEVSGDTAEIISRSLEISEKTDGALDITIYPVLKAWGFTAGQHRIPPENELAELLQFVDYRQVKISGNTVSVPTGFMIDLGALAKGYAADTAAETLKSEGISSALLNLGGNICAVGSKSDGKPWKIAAASPFEDEDYVGVLEISDKSVVTSGKYERYFTGGDGKNYHHIIDPKNGFPSENGLAAVTIIGDSGVICDALSTALLVMGEQAAIDFRREYGGFDFLLVTDDRRLIVSGGVWDCFTASEGFTAVLAE